MSSDLAPVVIAESLLWSLPFAGLLLSIALFPLVAGKFWHHHYGKIALFWALSFLLPYAFGMGWTPTVDKLLHVFVGEYVPFIVLVGSLFVVAGGIHLSGTLVGKPSVNLAFLAIGAALASLMGTTGAAMLLIRPLVRANEKRRYSVHTFVFFIFLVANIGGALSPIGDPPLFIGFLEGVPFFWPLQNLMLPTLVAAVYLFTLYFVIETVLYRREGSPVLAGEHKLGISGGYNFIALVVIIAAVLIGGFWNPAGGLTIGHEFIDWSELLRDGLILSAAAGSWFLTPKVVHDANQYDWEPVREVAKLFAAIFVCIAPVLETLKAGQAGALGFVHTLLQTPEGAPHNLAYFWLTGSLSGFLDNAPTYLVFFQAAGGDVAELTGVHNGTLVAISMAAVFFGALSYIGNAPNFMVKSVVCGRGLKMPGFFGYVGWACVILLPLFILLSALFIRYSTNS